MDILDIANKYSSLFVIVAAITTIATGFYKVRKNRPDGTFRLRKEHTNTLKKEIIEPWIEQLKEKGEAKKGFPPFVYTGKDLPVEGEKRLLFNDMENHVDKKLLETYERFKVNCRELSKKIEDLERKLCRYLKDENGFRLLAWEDFYKENKETREPGFFNTACASSRSGTGLSDTLYFFLDLLLSGCSYIGFKISSNSIGNQNEFDEIAFYCRPKQGKIGVYIDRNITEEKKAEIKNKIEETLKETKNEFKNEIVEINELIDNINKDKSYVLEKLDYLKNEMIYNGKCKFIEDQ